MGWRVACGAVAVLDRDNQARGQEHGEVFGKLRLLGCVKTLEEERLRRDCAPGTTACVDKDAIQKTLGPGLATAGDRGLDLRRRYRAACRGDACLCRRLNVGGADVDVRGRQHLLCDLPGGGRVGEAAHAVRAHAASEREQVERARVLLSRSEVLRPWQHSAARLLSALEGWRGSHARRDPDRDRMLGA
jgi:hypothetical protein